MRKTEFIYKKGIKGLLSEAPEDEEETEEETEEEDPELKGNFENSLDADLDAIFIDFETEARKSVVKSESFRNSTRLLYEDSDLDEINIDVFASNVARLVKNYENLLDMEDILVSRAKEFLEDRYGEEAGNSLVDELEKSHDVEMSDPKSLKSDFEVPLALGARSSEG